MFNTNAKLLATAGMVLGVLGLWFLGLFAAIPAILLGYDAKKTAKATNQAAAVGLSMGSLVIGYVALALSLATGSLGVMGPRMWGGSPDPTHTHNTTTSKDSTQLPITEEALRSEFQSIWNSYEDGAFIPQILFDLVHPIGSASRVEVHDVTVTWDRGRPTGRLEDMVSYTCRFTIYWQSILIANGYTKLELTYDYEVGAFTHSRILATNGQTIEEAAYNVGWFIGALLASEW